MFYLTGFQDAPRPTLISLRREERGYWSAFSKRHQSHLEELDKIKERWASHPEREADDNLCDTTFSLTQRASSLWGRRDDYSAMRDFLRCIRKRCERPPSLPSSAYCASHFQFAAIMGSDNHLALKADCIGCAQVWMCNALKCSDEVCIQIAFSFSKKGQEIINSGKSSKLNERGHRRSQSKHIEVLPIKGNSNNNSVWII